MHVVGSTIHWGLILHRAGTAIGRTAGTRHWILPCGLGELIHMNPLYGEWMNAIARRDQAMLFIVVSALATIGARMARRQRHAS
jgi:hypothetical protein